MKLFSASLVILAGMILLHTASAQDDCMEPACCEEDCCGQGTSWNGSFCSKDESSSGWSGVYSNDHNYGCVVRTCCGETCCDQGTRYAPRIAECIVDDTETEYVICHGTGSRRNPYQRLTVSASALQTHLADNHNGNKKFKDALPGTQVEVSGRPYILSESCRLVPNW